MERNYAVAIPKEVISECIDETFISKSRRLIVGAHILVPSKYKENLYQSLTGVNYVLDPVKKKLLRRLLRGRRFERFEVVIQDTQFTLHGRSFQRMIINKALDRRFQDAMRFHRSSSIDQRISTEASLQTVNE